MALTIDQIRALVAANNRSMQSDQLVIAICWKESSFDPSAAQAPPNTAAGLMQITDGARQTVNNITPPGTHYDPGDLLDGARNIQCGTYYLQWCFTSTGGNDERAMLQRYHGDPTVDYASDLITAEGCLRSGADAMGCLHAIHA